MYADSHCHLQLIDYDKLGIDMDAAVQNARENQVEYLLCVATHFDQNATLRKIADKYSNVRISVGLHPNDPIDPEPTLEDFLQAQNHPAVVAIGETGLDYYRTEAHTQWQQERFITHIRAAKECNKPLIIHSRMAKQDTLDILRRENAATVGGVLHCFTEDLDMALQGIDLNFYISFSGIVTFKNSKELQEVARQVPLERMLIETDCPFLAPDPVRGHVNQPANVRYVAEFIARLKNIDLQALADQTTANYKSLFKVGSL